MYVRSSEANPSKVTFLLKAVMREKGSRDNETSLHLVRCKLCSNCKQELGLTRRLDTKRSVKFAELESLREVSMGELRMIAR